jgi:hypothetical protein
MPGGHGAKTPQPEHRRVGEAAGKEEAGTNAPSRLVVMLGWSHSIHEPFPHHPSRRL